MHFYGWKQSVFAGVTVGIIWAFVRVVRKYPPFHLTRKGGEYVDKFLDLLERSVLVQGILTLALAGAVIYLCVTGQQVPDLLAGAFVLVLGFYFGSKTQLAISRKG